MGIKKVANVACSSVLPEKLKKRYDTSYKSFKYWYVKNTTEISENVTLAYFMNKMKVLKSSVNNR